MAASLRTHLAFFWMLFFAVSVTLGVAMVELYRSSAGAQIASGRSAAEASCGAIATRYAKSTVDSAAAKPQIDLLQVLLHLVLTEAPHVEGGVWQASGGMLAYAYPTYEGSGAKLDVPAAEQPLIIEMAHQAVGSQQLQTDVLRGSREALIVTACPLAAPAHDLAAWTMTRTSGGALNAQESLRVGLGVLTAMVMASGLWLGFILWRGLGHVRKLESGLAQAHGDRMPALERTGVKELDRIVNSFNEYRVRFEEARAQLREAAAQRSRDQRLAAIGRMTSGIAHEIRNPIAAMRLKAENALAASPERQPEALQSIVTQVDRLDGLVENLLAIVQPLNLSRTDVPLHAWLEERAAGVAPRADARRVDVMVEHAQPASADFDPRHLARAVDNLLDNAVRHASTGGRVLLQALPGKSGSLLIRVDDDGPGVAPAVAPQLFEPFATGRPDGTGLGLALAREVALAHGAELRHVALHPGTRFELELPWRGS